MNTCRDIAPLLSLRAAGALDGLEAERVEAHLARCEACRVEQAAFSEVLSLAKLPPVSAEERRALADLPARTRAALRREDGRRGVAKRLGAAGLAAAAAVALVLAPALLGRGPTLTRAGSGAAPAAQAQAEVAWQEPDLDSLWQDTALIDVDGSAVASASASDAALAAMEVTGSE